MRYIGIDYGTSKIGIALSDKAGSMGFPHSILTNTPRVANEIIDLIKRERVGTIVMGESRNFEGKDNPVAEDARKFAALLSEQAGIPLVYEPEVFTSAEARRSPQKEEKSRRPKQKQVVDDSAAALILTSYLSRHSHE